MVSRLTEMNGLDVFTEEGKHIGVLDDVSIDSDTGKILGMIVSKLDSKFSEQVGAEGKKGIVVPYSAVKSVGDIVLMRPISYTGTETEE
jgi:sporulation protein YlmC with PRC-barrel domain